MISDEVSVGYGAAEAIKSVKNASFQIRLWYFIAW